MVTCTSRLSASQVYWVTLVSPAWSTPVWFTSMNFAVSIAVGIVSIRVGAVKENLVVRADHHRGGTGRTGAVAVGIVRIRFVGLRLLSPSP